jgi:hypothetical protein
MNAAVEPAAARRPKTSRTAWLLLVAMVMLLPWPFYLLAVIAFTPIPVLVLGSLYPAFYGPLFAVLVLSQAALGAWVFHRIARRAARSIEASPARLPLTLAALGAIVAVTFLPLYGGGENMLGGGKMHDLYADLSAYFGHTHGYRPAPVPAGRPRTLEDLGVPQVKVAPTAPAPQPAR